MKFPNLFTHPLLAVAIEPNSLAVAAWSRSWAGWKLLHTERLTIDPDPLPEMIVATLRPLVLRWGLSPGTPVTIIVPPSIGGVVASKTSKTQKKGTSGVTEQELVKTLPFSLREIEWASQSQRFDDRQITRCFWLPKSWVNDLKTAFARIGFRVDEIFSRTEVIPQIEDRPTPDKEGAPVIAWVEVYPGRCYFHVTQGLIAVSSRVLFAEDPAALAKEVSLELITLAETRGFKARLLRPVGLSPDWINELERIGLPIKPVPINTLQRTKSTGRPPYAVTALAQTHKTHLTGIWIVPDRDIVLRPLYQVALLLVALGLIISSTLFFISRSWEKDNVRMKAEIKKLNPTYQEAVAFDNSAKQMKQTMGAAQAINNGINPLDPLYRIYELLPHSAWIDQFAYHASTASFIDAGSIKLSGFGMQPELLKSRLMDSPFFTDVKVVPRSESTDGAKSNNMQPGFEVEAEWHKAASVVPHRPMLPYPPPSAALANEGGN